MAFLRDSFASLWRIPSQLIGRKVTLHSPHDTTVVIDQINAAATSPFTPFASGVIGRVWWGRLSLRFRKSVIHYNAQLVLTGKVTPAKDGSTLSLRFRAPLFIWPFLVFWYAFLALITLAFLIMTPTPDFVGLMKFTSWTMVALFWILPLAMHAVGTRHADEELDQLLGFLEREVAAREGD